VNVVDYGLDYGIDYYGISCSIDYDIDYSIDYGIDDSRTGVRFALGKRYRFSTASSSDWGPTWETRLVSLG
jgi:hypothetical protein